MATNYKVLGQGVNSLKIDAPANGSTIISELKIKNSSYPTNVDVAVSAEFYNKILASDFPIPNGGDPYAIKEDRYGNIYHACDFRADRLIKKNREGVLDSTFISNISSVQKLNTRLLMTLDFDFQSDDKIILAGRSYYVYNNGPGEILRININGTHDTSFFAEHDGPGRVDAVTVQPDDKILIGGTFVTINSVTRNKITRLNSNGSLDTSFNPSLSPNSTVFDIALQSDGKIIIGGQFTSINGVTTNRVARLNADGSVDTSFNADVSGTVLQTVIQPDGKILIGGFFTVVNGVSRRNIARLNADGSLDTSFNPYNFFDAAVTSIALQEDGKIIVGGDFSLGHVFRINSDGSLDSDYSIVVASSSPYALTLRGLIVTQDQNVIAQAAIYQPATVNGVPISTSTYWAGSFKLDEQGFVSDNNGEYLIKNKSLSYDEEIKISGGIALESGQSLVVETGSYRSDAVIIQAYGIEETA